MFIPKTAKLIGSIHVIVSMGVKRKIGYFTSANENKNRLISINNNKIANPRQHMQQKALIINIHAKLKNGKIY